MDRRLLIIALTGGAVLFAGTGVLIATAEGQGSPFIPGDKPVTEDQVREKLASDGYSNIQIVQQGRLFEALGTKDGKTSKVLVNAQTGRLASRDDDDDDD
jgi:hypothetical protein